MQRPLITLTTPELGGGIGRNLVNLANEFLSLGYQVDIAVDNLKGPYFDLLEDGVGIFHLGTTHPIGGLPRLCAYLLRNRPAVLMTPVVRHTMLALRARSLTGSATGIYARVHNTYSKTFRILKPRKRSIRIQNLQKYYPRCDAIFAVSKGVAKDFCTLTGIPTGSIIPIYNPMSTDRIDVLAAQEPDHPWFADGAPPVVLGVGRLTAAKNFPLLMEAFEIVRSDTPCRLVIIGEGPQRGELEKRAASSPCSGDISLPGQRINPFAFMSRAAVFVMSSSWEGFGNVLVEAMAAGAPVVSTDCPHGPREILADGRYGPLIPVEGAGEMAAAIRDLLENPTPKDLLEEGASRFNARTIATRYLEAFGLATPEDSGAAAAVGTGED
jgi:glycosyltransferase involved in cell wall biosynthesis